MLVTQDCSSSLKTFTAQRSTVNCGWKGTGVWREGRSRALGGKRGNKIWAGSRSQVRGSMYKVVITPKILRRRKKMVAGRTFPEDDQSVRKMLEEDLKTV